MAYSWTETISEGTNVEEVDTDEVRTNIDAERVDRAGLAAYSWTNADLEGDIVDSDEIAELRTASDEAYDLLFEGGAHYTSDDSTHYTTADSSHDSSVCPTHYTTDDSSHYSTDDASHDTTHNATHYVTHDGTHYNTHYAAANSSRKTYYCSGVYATGLCVFKSYDKNERRREQQWRIHGLK